MRKMLDTMRERLSVGDALVLVTITASSGATPRGTGARMLVNSNGRICGTIGGGAVEYRAEQLAMQVLQERHSCKRDFMLNREDVQNLGMICGGAVHVFFHYIPSGDAYTIALATEAERIFESGEGMWLLLNLDRSELSLYTRNFGFYGSTAPEWVVQQLSRRPKLLENGEESWCVEQINSPGRVYIFGCGHVSQELQPVLSHVGFRCVMLDDREEFVHKELFPTAEEVKMIDFYNIAETVSIGPEDYVCIMTRGHAYDTVIQAQVIKCKPCYMGVIGSKKKAAGVRQALKSQYGITDAELDIITTPIGLEIGAQTPAEIAISIAGQMIQIRAKRNYE